ncbi:MAG: hypothetical protein M0P31_17140 [Solirubrobacteraceae bacterium]|nr:hypothetical protein [Solirubrobacteraceae bacterium]
MRVTLATEQWRSGERYVHGLDGRRRVRAERIVELLGRELRRRLGSGFSVLELVTLYEAGASWALAIASANAPEDPDLWDGRVVDAAFHRHLTAAKDWGGGRWVVEE